MRVEAENEMHAQSPKNWSDTKYTRTLFSAKLNQEPIKTAKTMSSTELNQHWMQRSWSFVELNIDKRCSELRDRRRLARASTSTIYWKYCCAELPPRGGERYRNETACLKTRVTKLRKTGRRETREKDRSCTLTKPQRLTMNHGSLIIVYVVIHWVRTHFKENTGH